MKTFTDTAGRTWTLAISVNSVKRCRAFLGGFDLYTLVDEEFRGLAKLLGDPVPLVDVLYVLCKDEADARSLSDEDFGRGMAGDCLVAAADAFVAELADFFPDPQVRAALRKMMPAIRGLQDAQAARIEAMDFGAILHAGLAPPSSNGSSGGSPASSASTPAPSPSASST
jgi:hypothetical protein